MLEVVSALYWVLPELNPQAGKQEPVPKYEGMLAYADGTNWNPSLGRGVYKLISGVWKLVTSVSGFYETPPQTITAGGALGPFAHGFGVIPKRVQAVIVCQTAEFGYSQNAEVPINFNAVDASNTYGVAVQTDATNINIRFGSTNAAFVLNFGTGGGPNAVTPANWKLIVRVWMV